MITETLAAWIPTQRFEALPPVARSRAKLAIFDCCGTALAGKHHPAAQHLRQFIIDMGSAPQVRVLGDDVRLSLLDAAWLTGTMTDAYLYSDTHFPSNAHLTSVLLPLLLALGEVRDIDGPEAITAYVVGFEVATRLAAAINPEHYRRGWHTTAVAGVLGATATAGRLLGLSPARLQQAFGIATSEAAGSRCNFGTDTMPLHSGRAARSGLLSALLAAKGFTGNPQALEAPMGWLELFRGTADIRHDAILADLGQSFALERPELYFKFYANSAATHRFIDAVLELRQQGVTPEQIRRVVCRVNPTYVQTLCYAQPTTPPQARVSLQYAVAVALCDGKVGLPQFNLTRVQADDVQTLMPRIELASDPGLSATAGSDFTATPATVIVELTDGRSLTATVAHERGSPQRPPRRQAFEAKFRDCAKTVLSTAQTLLAMRYLYQLDTLPAMHLLLDGLSLAPGAVPAATENDVETAPRPEATDTVGGQETTASQTAEARLAALEARLRALENDQT
jgi:2-methylcitrate dehydratase PrpD